MTQKKIKASDVIGNSYYIYTLTSSNNTPSLNGTINITCKVTDVYGQSVSGKSITLYQNSTSKGSQTTNSSGNASWNSISMSSAGLQVFRVENSKIEVFVDNKSDVGHTHSQYLTSHQDISGKANTSDLGAVAFSNDYNDLSNKPNIPSSVTVDTTLSSSSNNAIANSTVKNALDNKLDKTHSSYKGKNVVTNSSTGAIEFEDKNNHTHSQYLTEHQSLANYVTTDDSRLSDARTPTSHTHTKSQITDFPTIPSASSTTPSADTQSGSVGTGTTWARSNHTHPKSSIYAESSHTHDQYLTAHQDISGKENTSNKVSSWSSTTNNTRYPTEKLVKDSLDGKQATLVSGTNLKTINNNSLLGSGNITITSGGTSVTVDSSWVDNSTNPVQSKLIKSALDGKANSSHTHSTTEIRDPSAHNRIGSGANDNQTNINDSIDYALAGLDDNILYTKMDLVGFDKFQVKDFINPNNWESSGCTYSNGVLTFSGSNSFTATFPTDSSVGELADFELSFDYIIDDGLILGDTIDFDIFGHGAQYAVTEDDINNGYVIIDVSFKSENNEGIITSEQSGDEWHINYVDQGNPYTINAITPVGNSTKITNIKYKANNIISLNDNKEDVYNKVTSISSSSTDTQYPSAKVVYDSLDVKEDKSNKVTSISSSSTDTQYPSAKCVYDGLSTKLNAKGKITTTFNPEDYNDETSTIQCTWTNKYTVSMSRLNGELCLDFSDMLDDNGNQVVFTIMPSNVITMAVDDTTLYSQDSTSYCIVISRQSSNTYSVQRYGSVTFNESTSRYVFNNLQNTIVVDSPYVKISNNFNGTTTVGFGNKMWYHEVSFIDKIYPVGSIYMSVNSISPSLFIGGTWEKLKDKFLLGSGDTYSAGSTGGSADAIVVSHSHEPSNTDFNFLATNVNIAINATQRSFPSTGSSMYEVYASSAGGINEYATTNTVGSSGTGKNMPPYVAVYIWKRIA